LNRNRVRSVESRATTERGIVAVARLEEALLANGETALRNETFCTPEFPRLVRKYGAAICYAHHNTYSEIADVTGDFVYARLQRGEDDIPTAYPPNELDGWAKRARLWAEGGQPDDLPLMDPTFTPETKARDVFVYFIHEGKIRAPHAARAFMERAG